MADTQSSNTNGNGRPVPSERKLAKFRRKSSRDLLAAVIHEDEVYSHMTEVAPPGVISEDYQSDTCTIQSEAYSDKSETGQFMKDKSLSGTKGSVEELKNIRKTWKVHKELKATKNMILCFQRRISCYRLSLVPLKA